MKYMIVCCILRFFFVAFLLFFSGGFESEVRLHEKISSIRYKS